MKVYVIVAILACPCLVLSDSFGESMQSATADTAGSQKSVSANSQSLPSAGSSNSGQAVAAAGNDAADQTLDARKNKANKNKKNAGNIDKKTDLVLKKLTNQCAKQPERFLNLLASVDDLCSTFKTLQGLNGVIKSLGASSFDGAAAKAGDPSTGMGSSSNSQSAEKSESESVPGDESVSEDLNDGSAADGVESALSMGSVVSKSG